MITEPKYKTGDAVKVFAGKDKPFLTGHVKYECCTCLGYCYLVILDAGYSLEAVKRYGYEIVNGVKAINVYEYEIVS